MLRSYFNDTNILNLKEGDIIEVENHGKQEYMIYSGIVGSKPNVLFALKSSQDLNRPHSPSFMEKWVTGYKKTDNFASHNPGGIQCIKIYQAPVDQVIQNATIKKNNFDHVNLAPNAPEIIVDRAMFKVLDDKSNPHFKNSQDWVIWCRYGKDIIKKETNVPSQLQLVGASGKY